MRRLCYFPAPLTIRPKYVTLIYKYMKYLFPADTLLRKGRPLGRAGGNIHEESHKNGCIYIIIFNIKRFHRLFGVSALFFVRRKRVVRRVDRQSGHDRAGRCHSAYLAARYRSRIHLPGGYGVLYAGSDYTDQFDSGADRPWGRNFPQ